MSKYTSVYYDPSNPGSFGGVHRLWQEVGGSKQQVEEWLKTQDTYTLHRPARKRLTRNRIQVAGLDDQWEADLVDMQGLAKQNNNIKHLLTVVDALSKFAFVVPLKDKTGPTVVKAFKHIFKTRKPRKLRTDKGKEFLNRPFQQFLKEHEVIFFTSNNETKCAMVERFNRTLRQKLWRYFTATRRDRYIDILQDVVDSYNRSIHRTTGYAPEKVNVMNADMVWKNMYGDLLKGTKIKPPKYKIGNRVRISKAKKTFEKGYRTNWTREIFRISRVYRGKKIHEYNIEDLDGEAILGKFLEKELQAVHHDETQTFKIRKVLKKNPKGEILVQWEGYPDKFRSWIPKKDLPKYK